MAIDAAHSDVDRFRAAVLADAALQDELQAFDDVESFIAGTVPRAQALGIPLAEGQLRQVLRDDPLGLARWSSAPPTGDVPQRGWLPVHVLPVHGQICVDWAYFGEQPIREPFFEDSVRHALRRPINRLARHRTALADLARAVEQSETLQPSGFIFHMSRCGSTLVSRMLASDSRNIAISEANPIDIVVRLDFGGAADEHAALLRSMVRALGRRRAAGQDRYFVKLDSWHTLALPLFHRAFPSVPWIFLYREPADVLASQMRQRGIQTVPEYLPPALFGLTEDDGLVPDEYCAGVLQRICEAAVEPYAQGGGLLVNYNELPQAVWSRILPHFGIEAGAEDRAEMAAIAQFDAKRPGELFSGPSVAGRNSATDRLRATAARRLGEIHARLEALRLGA